MVALNSVLCFRNGNIRLSNAYIRRRKNEPWLNRSPKPPFRKVWELNLGRCWTGRSGCIISRVVKATTEQDNAEIITSCTKNVQHRKLLSKIQEAVTIYLEGCWGSGKYPTNASRQNCDDVKIKQRKLQQRNCSNSKDEYNSKEQINSENVKSAV